MATFDERAADWDTPDKVERAEALADVILRRATIAPGSRAIEVGAGTGLLGLAVADRLAAAGTPFTELVLADPAQGMLDVAAGKLRERGLSNVRTVRYALTTDPLPDGAPFDLALSLLVLHHVESTPAALASLHDLVRGGGRLALADLDAEDGTFHDPEAEGIHHHGFDRHLLAAQAHAAGFRDVEVATGTEIEREGRRYPVFLLTAVAG